MAKCGRFLPNDDKDKQRTHQNHRSGFGIVDALVNIPKSKSQSIELSLTRRRSRGLTRVFNCYISTRRSSSTRGSRRRVNWRISKTPRSRILPPKYQLGDDGLRFPRGSSLRVPLEPRPRTGTSQMPSSGFDDPTYQITGLHPRLSSSGASSATMNRGDRRCGKKRHRISNY